MISTNPNKLFERLKEEADNLDIQVSPERWGHIEKALEKTARPKGGIIFIEVVLLALIFVGINNHSVDEPSAQKTLQTTEHRQEQNHATLWQPEEDHKTDKQHEAGNRKIYNSNAGNIPRPNHVIRPVRKNNNHAAVVTTQPVQTHPQDISIALQTKEFQKTDDSRRDGVISVTSADTVISGSDNTAGNEAVSITDSATQSPKPVAATKGTTDSAINIKLKTLPKLKGLPKPSVSLWLSGQRNVFRYVYDGSPVPPAVINTAQSDDTAVLLDHNFKRSGYTFQGGFDAVIPLSEHWSIVPGIGIQSSVEHIGYRDKQDSAVILFYDPVQGRYNDSTIYTNKRIPGNTHTFSAVSRYITLPVQLRYSCRLNDRWKLYAALGTQADMILSGKSLRYDFKNRQYNEQAANNRFNLSVRFTAGVNYKITDRLSFDMMCLYQNCLFTVRKNYDPLTMTYRSTGINIGIRYSVFR